MQIQIRWLIRRDMKEVIDIEKSSFLYPWSEEDFLCCLRQRNCIGMVAEYENHIVGFMIYELHKKRLSLLNFAIHPDARHQEVGTQLVKRLKEKLSKQRRVGITVFLRESNLDAQLFFRHQKFVARQVLRGYYDDSGEDAYFMSFLVEAEDSQFSGTNRISQYLET